MKILNVITPLAATLFTLSSLAGEMVDKSLPLNNANKVTIESLRGEVVILGESGNKITVKGELDDKAEGFIFEQEGSQILIKIVMPRNLGHASWNEKGSNLTINLPASVKVNFDGVSTNVKLFNVENNVNIQTVSGDINANNLSNTVRLSSVSGNIKSENINGKLNLSTVSGDIRDSNSSGQLSIKTVSGSIKTKSSASEVSVDAVSGEISVQLSQVEEFDTSTVSGDFEGLVSLVDNGLIKMSSVSGDMSLTLNKDVQAYFKMSANAGGNLVNHLTSDKAQRAKYGPSSTLYFSKGNGNSSVKASTVSGRVILSAH